MLTYTAPPAAEPKPHYERPWALLLLCFLWLIPGVFGHDPWKPDELEIVGIVHGMLSSENWVVPHLAGEPWLSVAPLYYQTAALFARLLTSDSLPMHDAARLATIFYMSIALLFSGMAGRDLIGLRFGRVVVVILIGCLGLLIRGHLLSTDSALLAGFAIATWGLVVTPRSAMLGGLGLGLGTGVVAASSTLFNAASLWLVVVLLPICFARWRSPRYLQMLIVATIFALPLVLGWPLVLRHQSSQLFGWWWDGQLERFEMLRGEFFLANLKSYSALLCWFAWPALPLAIWTLWDRRPFGYSRPELQFPLLMVGVMFGVMLLGERSQDVNALPLLLPLSLLAAVGIDRLRRGAAAALRWFGCMLFGLLSTYIWAGWTAANFGFPAGLANRRETLAPGFHAVLEPVNLVLSLLLVLVWIWAVRRRLHMGRQAISSWAAGVTLSWSLLMLLWMPGLDYVKSYRSMVEDMRAALPSNYDCIATREVRPSIIAIVDYYTSIHLYRQGDAQCQLMLIQDSSEVNYPGDNWRQIWEGARPGDRHERFRLYERVVPQSLSL